LIDRQLGSRPYGPDAPRPLFFLIEGPLVPHIDLWEPCYFAKLPDGPQTYTLNVLWLQEGGAQILMSEWSQSFTLTKNMGHASYTMDCLKTPLGEDVSLGYYVQWEGQ